MAGLQKSFDDLNREYNKEIFRPIYHKKGFNQLNCEVGSKIKYKYTGYCIKEGDKIVKTLPDLDSFGQDKKLVMSILKKPLNKRKLGNWEYFKLSEL